MLLQVQLTLQKILKGGTSPPKSALHVYDGKVVSVLLEYITTRAVPENASN